MNNNFTPDGSGYDTHLPILQFIHNTIGTRYVFEYGTGAHSTGFFNSIGAVSVSCEMQDENWFNEMYAKFGETTDAVILKRIGEHAAIGEFYKQLELMPFKKYGIDLVFVDGHGSTRPECVLAALGKADTIVYHDSENEWYGWKERVYLSGRPELAEYDVFQFEQWHPQTTVLTRNVELSQALKALPHYTINTVPAVK